MQSADQADKDIPARNTQHMHMRDPNIRSHIGKANSPTGQNHSELPEQLEMKHC